MDQPSPVLSTVTYDDDEISLLSLANILLRWRRTIVILGTIGLVIGLVLGLTSTRLYQSSATFVPQGSESGASAGLALAAQIGIRLPTAGGTWGPPMYVTLLGSRALLEPIARDTIIVAEQGGRRVPMMDLLKVKETTPARRADAAVRALSTIVSASEVKGIGAVKVSAKTPWPSVSLALAQLLVNSVNDFNAQTRQSQAAAERQFVERQAGEAEHELRASEDRLQAFLQSNREIMGSPQLTFERDRLQRDVSLRQQIYTSLLQSREDARIREVRDIPVITMVEPPVLPTMGESRGTLQKMIIDGVAGVMLGIAIAFLSNALASARKRPSDASREFFVLVDSAIPRFLRPSRQ
jgi:uncharacterized protein involved in exopolysaccharide biosynthesis